MDEKHLEENFAALLQDINEMRPKRRGSFITRFVLIIFTYVHYYTIMVKFYTIGAH